MSRQMIDCEGVNAVTVHERQPDIAIVGCYDTGTDTVVWNEAEKELWQPGRTLVTIDQGYLSPAVTVAIVRDVEPECWEASKAVNRGTWSPDVVRPTIYSDQDNLPAVISAGWNGDLWLAIPGWKDGDALPAHGSCTVVAVQNQENVDNLYDLSIVLDDYWPERKPAMPVDQTGWAWCSKCQGLFFGPKQSESACPRGGQHDGDSSWDYTLTGEEK
jgi:hypothetical protein